MPTKKTVLVTGATGKQGGAAARALLRSGHNVLALTRTPERPAAQELQASGARLVQGDFRDMDSLESACRGADVLYAMGTPFEAGTQEEVRQGKALIDAAEAAGVAHVIYSSVAGADQASGVPHFESKFQVEQYLAARRRAYTIVAPVAFMDFLNPIFREGLRAGELRMALPPQRPLQYISVRDIGRFAGVLVERGEQVFGQRFEIAGDELAGEETADVLSRASGRDIRYIAVPPDALRAHSEDIALMFEWLDAVGYAADRAALRQAFPEVGWQSLEDWAHEQDWQAALAPAGERAAR
jgi:uncharacterized protein YbjT (DUF2867 family)